MSDRLDDALRHLARADAPADLSARVRAALEMAPRAAPLWPRLSAAAAVVVLLAVVGAFVVGDRGDEAPPPHAAATPGGSETAAPPLQHDLSAGGPSARAGGTFVRAGGTSVRAGGTFLSAVASAEAEVPPTRYQPSADHQHALPSLAAIAAVGPAALSTPPMSVEATEIAPLTLIAPMEIPALDAGEGERR